MFAIKATKEPVQKVDSSKRTIDSQLFTKNEVSGHISGSVDFSLTSGLYTGASSCDTTSEIKIDDTNDASDGLSIMARDVHSDGTAVMVKGQQSNIFQSKYKIQDKVCKLIINGGSFANVISSDLVHAFIFVYTEAYNTALYAMDESKWYTKNYS